MCRPPAHACVTSAAQCVCVCVCVCDDDAVHMHVHMGTPVPSDLNLNLSLLYATALTMRPLSVANRCSTCSVSDAQPAKRDTNSKACAALIGCAGDATTRVNAPPE